MHMNMTQEEDIVVMNAMMMGFDSQGVINCTAVRKLKEKKETNWLLGSWAGFSEVPHGPLHAHAAHFQLLFRA